MKRYSFIVYIISLQLWSLIICSFYRGNSTVVIRGDKCSNNYTSSSKYTDIDIF